MPEPRGFAILVPSRRDVPLKKKNVTLAELRSFPGSWKVRGLDRITDGTLNLISENEDLRHFSVEMKYLQRSVIAPRAVEVSGNFDVWQHRGGFAVAVNCPTFLVDAVASLISLSIYEDLGGITGKTLKKEDFIAIQAHAFSLGGIMTALHLRGISVDGYYRSVYNTTGKNIGKEEEKIKSAKKVKRIGFRFPRLGDSQFYFWVADWGGGTLYQPSQLLPHQVITLAKFFEEALRELGAASAGGHS
jgi:hypothetical protein